MSNSDTIAAIATPPGRGSVGIVRLSGPAAKTLAEQFTQNQLTPRTAYFGNFYHPHTGELIDQGIALFFEGPHSFTGEDVLELQGHGGPVVMDQLLSAATHDKSVRLAKPGEFSERAFLNNKMDLTQAEAIADLISASSTQAAQNAMQSLQGVFSHKIGELVDKITYLRIYTEAAIDFPEEEIDFLKDETLISGIQTCQQQLEQVFQEAQQGVIMQEGMTVVIAGKPNAGKSSLLNALAGRESAIVTDIPGTTRDLLKEHIHIDGMPLHLIDTAGLRSGGDKVERIGMQRARQQMEQADRLLLIVDVSELEAPIALDELVASFNTFEGSPLIAPERISIIFNKIDLLAGTPELINTEESHHHLFISTKDQQGIQSLRDHLKAIMGYQQVGEGGFTARRRHLDALSLAKTHLDLSYDQLSAGSGELVAEELKQVQSALGEITGEITADDLLGKIFSSFCIGK